MLPVGAFTRSPAPDAEALLALPLVGVTIGALAGFAALGVSFVAPHTLAAATALGVLVIASGAMHLDGFLDGCDAFFASVPPPRRLEILKDPRHGTFALAGLFVLGTFWYAALVALPVTTLPVTLALCGALARVAAILNASIYPYSRGGKVDGACLAFVVVAIACGAYLIAPVALAFVPAALIVSWLLGRWIARRAGGVLPGDGYGFIVIVIEVAVTNVAAALAWAGRWPGHG